MAGGRVRGGGGSGPRREQSEGEPGSVAGRVRGEVVMGFHEQGCVILIDVKV